MGIDPHWKLWQYFFSAWVAPSRGCQLYVGSTNIQLCTGRKTEYFKIPLSSSMRYEGEWSFVKNVARSASLFTGCESVSTEEWHHGAEANLKSEVEHPLTMILTSKQQGLTIVRLVRTFMHRWIQPLIALSAFRDWGVPKPMSECRRVPQPRWVDARPSAKGGSEVAGDGRERGGNPAAFVFVPRPGRVRLQ
jgi:hypothetical protein